MVHGPQFPVARSAKFHIFFMSFAPLYTQLRRHAPLWAPFTSQWDQVAISSRVRLARNLSGEVFPVKAPPEVLERLCRKILREAGASPMLRGGIRRRIAELQEVERDLLVERHLISPGLGRGGPGRAVVIAPNQYLSVLVNEEDHLRIQAVAPGLALDRVARLAGCMERALAADCAFAFDEELGYLTSCPSNLGTGLRASVMLHLPASALCGRIERYAKALQKLGCALRGALGEGSEAVADLYQVSNQSSLGEDETAIVERLQSVVEEIITHENEDRLRLVREERVRLDDTIGRAYGIVRFAGFLNTEEALSGISALIMGLRYGCLRSVSAAVLNRLFLDVQPGHLQALVGRHLAADERDAIRAAHVRAALASG
ncbi:MAG: ATP--guanido phosphotransferase [Lentisphaeria bacterium]|nr:ATP--guanido phosphotransferase [Lentisphaeria bacterium]